MVTTYQVVTTVTGICHSDNKTSSIATTEKEVVMPDVLFLATGVKHQPVRMVRNVYTVLSKVWNIMHIIIIFFPKFLMLHFLSRLNF